MPWYEESFGEDYLIVYRHRNRSKAEREIRSAVEWLHLKPGSEVLDLCCGTGRHSIVLEKIGFKVTGVDLSPFYSIMLKSMQKEKGFNMYKEICEIFPSNRMLLMWS